MKCTHCGGTGEINTCYKCNTRITGKSYFIKDYEGMKVIMNGDNEWGPFCASCIELIHKPIQPSRDMTERHDMTSLLDDVRTRPTEPPEPPEKKA